MNYDTRTTTVPATPTVLHHGYSVAREYCGHAAQRHVVRQYGAWVGSYANRTAALSAVAERGGVLVGRR